jgi:cytochrome c biogenesis protein CcdA
MSDSPPPDERRRRAARNDRQQHAVLAACGLSIYFMVLWFGVTVVGDTVPRSSLMAGLIVILAAMGYVTSRRPSPPNK